MSLTVEEDILVVRETNDKETQVVTVPEIHIVEIGVEGPMGPTGGDGFTAGLLADRPASPPEGSVYVATDDHSVAVFLI